jgi:hypothetical protein
MSGPHSEHTARPTSGEHVEWINALYKEIADLPANKRELAEYAALRFLMYRHRDKARLLLDQIERNSAESGS